MKNSVLAAAFVLLLSVVSAPVRAQTPATLPDSKVAVIFSEVFAASSGGIARYGAVIAALNKEFEGKQKELEEIAQKVAKLSDELEKAPATIDTRQLIEKMDQLDELKRDRKKKGEAAQAQLEKRQSELMEPLSDDIDKAIKAYARAHGIHLVIDASNVPGVHFADLDITTAFIADYNSRNPVPLP